MRTRQAFPAAQRPLLRVKRTWCGLVSMSANDPKRTLVPTQPAECLERLVMGERNKQRHLSGAQRWHLEGDGAMSMAIAGNVSFPVSTCVQLTEIVTLQGEQDEVHSVVVDMPQVISLEYASPETWDELPMVQPYEQPPATPVLQVAMSVVGSRFSN
jgi:hypothetical protein